MHSTRWPIMVIATTAAALLSIGCERETATDVAPPSAPTTSTDSAGPGGSARAATRRAPTTDEIFGTATRPATGPTARPASNDPLATPDSAVTYMFDLMRKQDVSGVRAMMADPLPADQLRGQVSAIAQRLDSGAKWQIVDTHTEGVAAIVIFRTTFPDGREELEPIALLNRYDRWKVMLGPMNVRKYTPGEKEGMTKTMSWASKRLNELRGVTTTQATAAPQRQERSNEAVKP